MQKWAVFAIKDLSCLSQNTTLSSILVWLRRHQQYNWGEVPLDHFLFELKYYFSNTLINLIKKLLRLENWITASLKLFLWFACSFYLDFEINRNLCSCWRGLYDNKLEYFVWNNFVDVCFPYNDASLFPVKECNLLHLFYRYYWLVFL